VDTSHKVLAGRICQKHVLQKRFSLIVFSFGNAKRFVNTT
jgi:hypothetical protein